MTLSPVTVGKAAASAHIAKGRPLLGGINSISSDVLVPDRHLVTQHMIGCRGGAGAESRLSRRTYRCAVLAFKFRPPFSPTHHRTLVTGSRLYGIGRALEGERTPDPGAVSNRGRSMTVSALERG